METRIESNPETYSEQEIDERLYDNSNIVKLQTEKENVTKTIPNVSANINADITPEHIKELCDGVRRNKETVVMIDAYKDQLMLNSLSSEERENVMRHMDNVVKLNLQSKLAQDKNARIWKIILASGVSVCLFFLGRGYYLKCRNQ